MFQYSLLKTTMLIGLALSTTSALATMVTTDVKPIKNPIVANTPADEAKVTSTIKSMISKSHALPNVSVDVSTKAGIVTLKGTVDSDAEASALVEIAESVIGVKDVNTSELNVKGSTQPLADAFTTAKVKGLFIREDLFGEKDINSMNTTVETKEGVVYITGIIDDKAQVDNAIEIIKQNVPEVKKVVYNVKKITPVQQ